MRARLLFASMFAVAAACGLAPQRLVAADRGDEAYWTQALLTASRSSDLRVRVVLSPFLAKPLGDVATIESLVEAARGSTDPLVLSTLVRWCGMAHAAGQCDALALARRWTEADAQNQIAWLALGDVLRARGDVEASRDALVHAARASRWHPFDRDIAQLLRVSVPMPADPRRRLDALVRLRAMGIGRGGGSEAMQSLWAQCKDPHLREPCTRILDVVMRDTDSLIALFLATKLSARLDLPDAIVRMREERADAVRYAVERSSKDDGLDALELPSDPDRLEVLHERVAFEIARGEIEGADRTLKALGLSTADAARRLRTERPSSSVAPEAASPPR